MVGNALLKYILIPLFVIAPVLSRIVSFIKELLTLPLEETESLSGVGPPNSELILAFILLIAAIIMWLLLNIYIFIPFAKYVTKGIKVSNQNLILYVTIISQIFFFTMFWERSNVANYIFIFIYLSFFAISLQSLLLDE